MILHAAPLLKTTLLPREDIQVLYGDHTKRLIRTLAIALFVLPLAALRLRSLRGTPEDAAPPALAPMLPFALRKFLERMRLRTGLPFTSPLNPLSRAERGGNPRSVPPRRLERGPGGEVSPNKFQNNPLSQNTLSEKGPGDEGLKTSSHTHSKQLVWTWIAGVVLPLMLITSFIIYVNPRKYYGANVFESPWMQMRWFKTEYYARLPQTPDIVVLGSSRAFQISPTYIEEQLGYSAFNAAVDGGNIGDALVMTKFMLERHDQILPKVLLIEVTPPLQKGTTRTATRSPVSLLPYMPVDTTQVAITERLIALFDVQQLSEAIYSVRRHMLYGPFDKPVALHPDGEVVQVFDQAEFNDRLERTLNQGGDMLCDDVDAEGAQIVDELIGLVEDHGTSIIFYISPRHPRYYALYGDDPQYTTCHQNFVAYMDDLRREHPNVYFLDYSRIDSIGGIATPRGFYDVFHITEYNGNLIIDAAAGTIRQAYRTAMQQRVQR